MHALIEKVEAIEAEIERLHKLATVGAEAKIKKLQTQLEKTMDKIAATPKAVASWEEHYAEPFAWKE